MIGSTLGRFRVRELLGEGGMGRVYLADDPALSRQVAIKLLPPAFAADTEGRERLRLEARAASALNHPNIVTIHELGEHEGSPYVAMEYVAGTNLRGWVGARPRPPAELLAMVRQATRGLAVAHAAGLVHRDLKPENLMVRGDGLLKVLDFGLARSTAADAAGGALTQARTLPGTVLGTAPYMSPEQVLGRPAGPASDVFSIATVLYECLAGRHPFEAGSAVETMHRILHETPPPPSKLVPGLPSELDFVLAKALARDPERRYASARELDLDLETCEAALRAGADESAAGAQSAAAAGPATLAVLPFKNIGGDRELAYLGVGLADAVITRLSSSPDLIVRATSSIARFENLPVDPRHVARELEVGAVLDASFQRAGNRFRATARLIEASGGRALWAGKIDLDFGDIFAVQDDVANGIAQALAARLGTSASAGYVPTADSFEMVLRAQEPYHTGDLAGFERGIGLLEAVVAREPLYADAWARLAKLYQSVLDSGLRFEATWYDKADEACRRALELDPNHPYALFTLGSLHLVRGRKHEAYRALIAQHQVQPNHSHVLHYLAYLFRLCNLVDASLDADARSSAADPSAPWPYWMATRVAIEAGRLEEARRTLAIVQARFPANLTTQLLDLTLLRQAGRYAEMDEQARRLGLATAGNSRADFEWAYALARLGRLDESRDASGTLAAHAAVDMDAAGYLASLLAWWGDPDGAFARLDRAVELGNDSLYLYEREDLYAPLHGDPRWAPFLEGVRARCAAFEREFAWPVAVDGPASGLAPGWN